MTVERGLLWLLIACLPVAAVLYMGILRRVRAVEPALLERIDPHGFRAMNASSQLRFGGYVNSGRYHEIGDDRLRHLFAAFRWLLYAYCLGWLAFLALTFF
jgi:hypothetical protein